MTKQERELKFAEVCVSLRGSNPMVWDQFMALLAARLEDISENAISSPPNNTLFTLQGRAQEARALFREIASAPSLVEQMKQKAQQTNVQSRTQGQRQAVR